MHPPLSIKQIQFDGISFPDEDDMPVSWNVFFSQLAQTKLGQLRIRHPKVVLLIQARLQHQQRQSQPEPIDEEADPILQRQARPMQARRA